MVILLTISVVVNLVLAFMLWRFLKSSRKMFVAGQAVAYKEVMDSLQSTIIAARDEK